MGIRVHQADNLNTSLQFTQIGKKIQNHVAKIDTRTLVLHTSTFNSFPNGKENRHYHVYGSRKL